MSKVKFMNSVNKIVELETKILHEYRQVGLDYSIYMDYLDICDNAGADLDFQMLMDVYKDLDSVKGNYLTLMNVEIVTNNLKQLRMLFLDINSDGEERIRERDYPRYRDYDLER